MAAPTARYYGYNFTDAAIGYNVSSVLTWVDLLYANKLSIKTEEQNIEFEGDGQKRTLYVTQGLSAEFTPDALNVAAAGAIFNKTVVTTSVPDSGSNLVWFGEDTETKGASVGFKATMSAIKNVAGTESIVTLKLYIPLGTLTLGAPGDVETAKKLGAQVWRLSAVKTTVDAVGAALPSVPTGGAFYALYEV